MVKKRKLLQIHDIQSLDIRLDKYSRFMNEMINIWFEDALARLCDYIKLLVFL